MNVHTTFGTVIKILEYYNKLQSRMNKNEYCDRGTSNIEPKIDTVF